MNVEELAASRPETFPTTEIDRLEVREQLERILASPQFRISKRYPSLLRFVVMETLEGRAYSLKERTIATEVFGRGPDYDAGLDHTVRTSAGEVRKRLAQYYVESGREREIRIELPVGSYVPRFRRHLEPEKPIALQVANGEPTASPQRERENGLAGWHVGWRAILAVTVAVVSIGAIILIAAVLSRRTSRTSPTPLDAFWEPIAVTSKPVALFIGSADPNKGDSDLASLKHPPTLFEVQTYSEKVAFTDATTLARFTGFLGGKGKDFRIFYGPQASLADLRQGPIVLIGAFVNDWTLRLTGSLRYHFDRDASLNFAFIRDRQNQGQANWMIDLQTPYVSLTEDYAIVSRVSDLTTGQIVIVAAGITKYGTMAAGEFLTGPGLNDLASRAPRDWMGKNLQIVLATRVVKGSSGPPRIVASYFW